MYWPKFSEKKLAKLAARQSRVKWGASCAYLRWTKNVGIKMYSERDERNRSYSLQKKAERAGLAPKTGEAFSFETIAIDSDGWASAAPIPRVVRIYCYWTEHVRLPRGVSYDRKDDLYEALHSIGIVHTDLYRRNLGVKGKKLVCIDFDSASCCRSRRRKRRRAA